MFGLFKKKPKPEPKPWWPPENLLGEYVIDEHVEGYTVKYRPDITTAWAYLLRSYVYHLYEEGSYGYEPVHKQTEYYQSLHDARQRVIVHNQYRLEEIKKAEHAKGFPKHVESVGPNK